MLQLFCWWVIVLYITFSFKIGTLATPWINIRVFVRKIPPNIEHMHAITETSIATGISKVKNSPSEYWIVLRIDTALDVSNKICICTYPVHKTNSTLSVCLVFINFAADSMSSHVESQLYSPYFPKFSLVGLRWPLLPSLFDVLLSCLQQPEIKLHITYFRETNSTFTFILIPNSISFS